MDYYGLFSFIRFAAPAKKAGQKARIQGIDVNQRQPESTMFTLKKSEKSIEQDAIIAAIGRSQAVIEFDLTGIILTANKNFLDVMGYTLHRCPGIHRIGTA